MSRSIKKTPVMGMTTARSEKQDKRIWHGRFRAQSRQALANNEEDPFIHERLAGNVWGFAKDGKRFYGPGDLRKLTLRYQAHYGDEAERRLKRIFAK